MLKNAREMKVRHDKTMREKNRTEIYENNAQMYNN
jgi:hypothetical protein